MVAYSCLAKTGIILELTICFETNFQDAKQRKVAEYSELAEEIEDRDFVVDLITLEVGSRGYDGSASSGTQLEPLRRNKMNCYSPPLW